MVVVAVVSAGNEGDCGDVGSVVGAGADDEGARDRDGASSCVVVLAENLASGCNAQVCSAVHQLRPRYTSVGARSRYPTRVTSSTASPGASASRAWDTSNSALMCRAPKKGDGGTCGTDEASAANVCTAAPEVRITASSVAAKASVPSAYSTVNAEHHFPAPNTARPSLGISSFATSGTDMSTAGAVATAGLTPAGALAVPSAVPATTVLARDRLPTLPVEAL